MATAKKAVAVKEEAQLPATVAMFEEDADQGFEEAGKEAFAIPFINILQSNSPQCKRSEGAYIDGAQEGMLYNIADGTLIDGDEGALFIPCHYRNVYVEWQHRDDGGGFVAEHSAADGQDLLKECQRDDKGKDILPNGNVLVDTRLHYGLMVDAGGEAMPVVLSMSSTQIKKSRKWMTVMRNIRIKRAGGGSYNPPMFSHIYRLTTVPESNDQGSWFGWKIDKEKMVDNEEYYLQAKAFRDSIVSGGAKTVHTEDVVGEGVEDEDF